MKMIALLPPILSWRQSRAYLRGAAAEPGKVLCNFCVMVQGKLHKMREFDRTLKADKRADCFENQMIGNDSALDHQMLFFAWRHRQKT